MFRNSKIILRTKGKGNKVFRKLYKQTLISLNPFPLLLFSAILSALMDSPKDFPLDAAFEILTRTSSLQTLDSCKLICKDWNQLLHEPIFMPTYCKNTNNIYGFFLQHQKPCKHVQEFIALEPEKIDKKLANIRVSEKFSELDDVRIEASSKQGLLCVVGRKFVKNRFYVGKPATGQWESLPNPKLRFFTQKVALVVLGSNPLRYKIIRLSQSNNSPRNTFDCYRYHCEIFDSKTWMWKTGKDIVLPNEVFLVNQSQPVQVGNLEYFLTTDHQVLAFNSEDETHHRFPLPESNNHLYYSDHSLLEYEGKLGFMNATEEENTEVWIMDDSNDHNSWRLVKEIEVEPSLKSENVTPGGMYNSDIALLKTCYKVVLYKLHDLSIEKSLMVNSPTFEHVFPFRSDFEPVKLRGEKISS